MAEWTAQTAEWYAEKYGEYATNRIGADALEIERDAVVVDIGCGTGSALRHLAERVSEGRLIGVEPVPRMLEIARERAAEHPAGHRLELLGGSAAAIPLEDASADWVLAFDSFDHWPDQRAGLAEVRRVLRGEGRLAVVKDGGLPGRPEAREAFLSALHEGGFRVRSESDLSEGDVTCTMWICERSE